MRDEVELIPLVKEDGPMSKRGIHCPRCGCQIPEYAELSKEDAAALRLLWEHQAIEAVKRLRERTGCDLAEAKAWFHHPDGPNPPRARWAGPPCPHCGKPLGTEKARQCFHCGKDWHNAP